MAKHKYPKKYGKFINDYTREYIAVIYSQFKEQFEEITGAFVSDDIFLELLLNARLFPHLNTKSPGWGLKEFHFEQNYKLANAAKWLYGQGNIVPQISCENPLDVSPEIFNEKGWYISKGHLNLHEVNGIKDQLKAFNYHVTTTAEMCISREEIISNTVEHLGKSAFSSQLMDAVIEEESPLGKVMTCNKIASTVSKLAGCPMYLVESTSLYSKQENKSNDDWKYNAKSWHIDFSHLKFIKVFVFLSDIPTPEYGAHAFVEGSHEDRLVYPVNKSDFWRYTEQKSGRLEGGIKDDWVRRTYSEDKIHAFCGKAGDVLFENTSGLHKQGPSYSGDRDLLQLLFAISNYGHLYVDNQFQLNAGDIWPDRSYLSPVSLSDRCYQSKVSMLEPKKTVRNRLGNIKRNILASIEN